MKVCSSTMFLYFACILPSIAFGALNDTNTHGRISRSSFFLIFCSKIVD